KEGKQRCPAVRPQLSAPLKDKKRRKAEVPGGAPPAASTTEKQEKKKAAPETSLAPPRGCAPSGARQFITYSIFF
ncbi:MAG TPA: hypothetical protein DEO89_06615, partial [Lachnospiraceae bacterium]|nr:hypothetical protein [Lachnospiraceae bacterium]